jgi:hypothetical protein
MSQTDAQVPPREPVKPQAFKSRYKLRGMIAAVILMWLDFAYLHHGLVTGDPGTMSAGMVVMLAASATAYYFG